MKVAFSLKNRFIPLLLGLGLLIVPVTVRAARIGPTPFSLTGWFDAVQSLRTHEPHDSLTSRARLRLELSGDFGALYSFASLDAEKNWQIDAETGVDPHEVWLEYAGSRWDVRIGRQIIIWGKADGVQITDIISPPDYTESISRELDEVRLPVDAVKLRWLGDYFDTELIWIPLFKAAVQAKGDNPWAVRQEIPDHVHVTTHGVDEPNTNLKNSELAFKVSGYFSGLDVAASVFYTWDDYAAYHRRVASEGDDLWVTYLPRHHRLTVFGLEFSRPWSDFVFRGEAAWYVGRYLECDDLGADPIARDVVKWLGGVDWSPGNDWSVIGQLTGDTIINYDAALADERRTCLATLNLSKELLRQTLTLSTMLYYDLDDNEFYHRLKAEYAVTDAWHVAVGADLFSSGNGRYGQYEGNSQVWIKTKYSF
nr:DUF1302 family protein [uncultured Desulfuromonas sp.]